MVDMHAHDCLEPEVLAAYVDHGLSLAERARVEHHLASCRECTALLAGVVRTVAAIAPALPHAGEPAEAAPLVSRRALAAGAVAAAAVLAVLVAPSLVKPWLDRDTGLVGLAGNVGEHRSVLGRLTGGFPHAPLEAASAGGQDARTSGTDRVLLTAGRIRESVGEMATPARLHELGVSQLFERRYDDAAELLLSASRQQPANARYLNDVATVQLERARLGLRPDDLPRALAAADRARRLDPSLTEAWFNRALAMSALQLTDQAKVAWAEYLRRDSTSPWAGEARQRLDELSQPTPAAAWAAIEGRLQQQIDPASADAAVRAQTTEARNFIENTLIVAWADAVLDGATGEAELERLRLMADAMMRVAGDAIYNDAAAAIVRAANNGASLRLAQAHMTYARASLLFTQDAFAEAITPLTASRDELRAVNSPFSLLADIQLAAIDYVSGRHTQGDSSLATTLSITTARNYLYASARATWFRGLIAYAQSRLADAQTHYEDVLATFEQMGDTEQVVSGHGLLASVYYYLGDKQNEWKHRQPMLAGLTVSRSARLRYSVLATAALSLRDEHPEAALAVQDAVVRAAEESGRPATVIEALVQRANILLKLNRHGEAAASVTDARTRLGRVEEPTFRQLFELVVLAAESELQRYRNPAAAIAAAQKGLDIIHGRNNPADRSRLPRLELQLAKAQIAFGRFDQAEASLERGIRAFDQERSTLSDEGRISVLDENWELFETGVSLALKKGDLDRAFALAERARARTLAEARRVSEPRSMADIQKQLQQGEVIVALNQFEDELAVWVIDRNGVAISTRPLSRLDATQLAARHQEEIWREVAEPIAGRYLYNEIIRPIEANLRRGQRVVFVPDRTFEHVAFAALWDASRRRFLIEDSLVLHAPSVESYVTASHDESRRVRDPLIVGGPNERATAGAKAIAAIHGTAAVVTGDLATSEHVLANITGHSIVHLAAETASNTTHPLLSRMLFADEPGRRYSGAVFGRDIAATSLDMTALVVLDEVRSNNNRGEGTLPLVRAFIAAGVPAVLATLPGIDETAADDLMIDFHREMTAGIPAGDALSRVQRNALKKNGGRLGAWTALVLYGSDR
jgi:CHAT domain-containing protein